MRLPRLGGATLPGAERVVLGSRALFPLTHDHSPSSRRLKPQADGGAIG